MCHNYCINFTIKTHISIGEEEGRKGLFSHLDSIYFKDNNNHYLQHRHRQQQHHPTVNPMISHSLITPTSNHSNDDDDYDV